MVRMGSQKSSGNVLREQGMQEGARGARRALVDSGGKSKRSAQAST